jgi:hypothetical protein
VRATETVTESEWDSWTRQDIDGLCGAETSAFLRSVPALPMWRAALGETRDNPRRAGERRRAASIVADITQQLAENKTLQKAANRAAQAEAKAVAKQRHRDSHAHKEAKRRAEKMLRADPEGARLHNAIHKMSMRLNRWAAGIVEEMGLDEEDEEWSRWTDEVRALARMVEQYEAMVHNKGA